MPKFLTIFFVSALAVIPFSDQESDSCREMVYVDGQPDHCVSEFPGTFPGYDPNEPPQVGKAAP